jgi:chemotaxis protein MotB
MAGHGGGAWKVAYADFVTAMMAFFLVMWITAQGKKVREAVAHYFNQPSLGAKRSDLDFDDPNGKKPAPGSNDPRQPLSLKGPKPVVPNIKRKAVGWSMEPPKEPGKQASRPVLHTVHDASRQLGGTVVQFAEQSAELNNAAKDALKQITPLLVGRRNKIEVRGHATARPLPPDSPYRDAWQLSYARCTATAKFLEQQGIEPERLRLSQAGSFEPLTIRPDKNWETQNSRVELYVLNESVDDLVGTREERAQRFQNPLNQQ